MKFSETTVWLTASLREAARPSLNITPPWKTTTLVASTSPFSTRNSYTSLRVTPVTYYVANGAALYGTNVGPGTYTWIAPAVAAFANVVAVGGGGGGGQTWASGGGGGGGLGWKNNIPVVGGQGYTVVVGSGGPNVTNALNAGAVGGNSYFISLTTVAGYGSGQGGPGATAASPAYGGGFFGDGGGRGGNGAVDGAWNRGGAGAGGYAGNGADADGSPTGNNAPAGGGGAAPGYYSSTYGVPAGGGVGLLGQGASGVSNGGSFGAGGGSGGSNGNNGEPYSSTTVKGTIAGGIYGGGGGGSGTTTGGGPGGQGGVYIVWSAD